MQGHLRDNTFFTEATINLLFIATPFQNSLFLVTHYRAMGKRAFRSVQGQHFNSVCQACRGYLFPFLDCTNKEAFDLLVEKTGFN